VNHVAVVGGGITGLAAAWELVQTGTRVTVLDAADRVGGRIVTTPFAGLDAVDEGADAFLARVPFGRQLATELGLGDDLVSPEPLGALVYHRGVLHPIPDGLVLGVPKGLVGLSRSGLLSARGKARAGLDTVLPRTALTDDSLGALVRARFGREVLERLVDPLVGSINAGDSDDLSLAAAVPQLAAVAREKRSLLLGLRRGPKPAPGPVFYAPRLGTGSLIDRLHGQLIARGVEVRTAWRSQELVDARPGVVIDGERFDGAVVATPAFAAADLLAEASPDTAGALRAVAYAGVVLVTVAVTDDQLAHVRPSTGYLVPKPEQRHVTAVSFASRKWAHLKPEGREVLRISLGHIHDQVPLSFDDDAVVRAALDEVGGHLRVELAPSDVRISRWARSFPQYEPHHLARVALIERLATADLPSVRLAGAAYRGIGIPACIDQGRRAARALTASLVGAPE
jgi:oxygen-dependent protoporphyrinogen oxidase